MAKKIDFQKIILFVIALNLLIILSNFSFGKTMVSMDIYPNYNLKTFNFNPDQSYDNFYTSGNCGKSFSKQDTNSIDLTCYATAHFDDGTTASAYNLFFYFQNSEDTILRSAKNYNSPVTYWVNFKPTNYWNQYITYPYEQDPNFAPNLYLTEDKCEVPASNIQVLSEPSSSDNYELKVHLQADFNKNSAMYFFINEFANNPDYSALNDALKKYYYMKAFVAVRIEKISENTLYTPMGSYNYLTDVYYTVFPDQVEMDNLDHVPLTEFGKVDGVNLYKPNYYFNNKCDTSLARKL